MKSLISFCVLIITIFSCTSEQGSEKGGVVENQDKSDLIAEDLNKNPKKVVEKDGLIIEVYDFENIRPFIEKENQKINVVNFWATWCAPCIAELPAFERLRAEDAEVEMTLISMDFANQIESRLIPYIQKNELQSEVIVLDDPDANTWIPKVDENWSGAIPATIIYTKDKRQFYERSFTFEELKKELDSFK